VRQGENATCSEVVSGPPWDRCPVLVALVGALTERNRLGRAVVVGSLNLGGSVCTLPHPMPIAELVVEREAKVLLMLVSARRVLNNLLDEM
jgi:ATP-dependent Lon protease